VGAAFGIDTTWTGIDLCDPSSPLRLETDAGEPADPADPADPAGIVAPDLVAVGARVGVTYAGDAWAARPWRFAIAGHRSVSGPASAWRDRGRPPAALPTD
jgi:3-methyladenine DNA glycosylase Mpg